MKKPYETPSVETVKFQYRDQVVAASSEQCINQYVNEGETACTDWTYIRNYLG